MSDQWEEGFEEVHVGGYDDWYGKGYEEDMMRGKMTGVRMATRRG